MKTETYNEALERARDALNDETISNDTIACLQSIFPELKKESEDEIIRKSIIRCIKGSMPDNIFRKKYIAWLEDKKATLQDNERAWLNLVSKVQELIKKLYSECTIKTYNPIEQKPADKIEPKFHEGELIVHKGTGNIYTVVAVIDDKYQLKYGDNYTVQKCADVDKHARLLHVDKLKTFINDYLAL